MHMYKYICICVHVCIHYIYGNACTIMYISGMSQFCEKNTVFNSVRSKYYILHLFKLFTINCVLFNIYGRQIYISP